MALLPSTPYMEDKERLMEEAEYSRLVGGSFNKQANFIQGFSWVATR